MRIPLRLPKIRRYYLPDDESPARRARLRLTRRPVPPFPRTVQIQTISGCNARCVFCPYPATAQETPHGRMEPELYRRIIEECAAHAVRRISPYLMNEPLLDREIWQRVRLANRLAPRARVTLTTNGALLDRRAVENILDIGGGLHELAVSVQGVEPDAYSRVMGTRPGLERVTGNVLALAEAMAVRGLRRPALTVTMVATRNMDLAGARDFWSRRGIAVRATPLDNQGGLVQIGEELPLGGMVPNEPCPRPHKQSYITWDGQVVVCCADYRRSVVLGSLRRDSLRAIWNGPLALAVRRAHIEGKREAMPALCRDCRIDSGQPAHATAAKRRAGAVAAPSIASAPPAMPGREGDITTCLT